MFTVSPPSDSCPGSCAELDPCRYRLSIVSPARSRAASRMLTISERIDRYQHMANIRLCLVSTCCRQILQLPATGEATDIDLPICESLLQVLIDSLIRDLADQGKIRHANFLLLRAFKDSLADLALRAASCRGRGILIATCALCHRLVRTGMSAGAP